MRPTPITVQPADVGRKMYETDGVDRYLAEISLENARLSREVTYWKLRAMQ